MNPDKGTGALSVMVRWPIWPRTSGYFFRFQYGWEVTAKQMELADWCFDPTCKLG